jgi:hypothetical protein
MYKVAVVLSVFLLSSVVKSQSFEGYIVYQNTVELKNQNLQESQVLSMVGEFQKSFYNAQGDYLNALQGGMVRMQYYIQAENQLYILMSQSDTLYRKDAQLNSDTAIRFEMREDVEVVNGMMCDEIVVESPQNKITYYFNDKYAMNPELYKNHNFGNWYYAISRAKALPLKTVIETPQFILTGTVIEVKEEKIDDNIFSRPKGVSIAPYRW